MESISPERGQRVSFSACAGKGDTSVSWIAHETIFTDQCAPQAMIRYTASAFEKVARSPALVRELAQKTGVAVTEVTGALRSRLGSVRGATRLYQTHLRGERVRDVRASGGRLWNANCLI
ncbi:hypothetical protein MRX96_008925 [Rhipicephalus microplus]